MMLNRIRTYLPTPRQWVKTLLAVLLLAGLYAVSQYHFLFFHCLTETFSIVIAVAVFAILWNTRQYLENGFYLVLGIGCLFAAVFNFPYIVGYPGMGILAFPGADGNVALQARTVAQWYISLSCVSTSFFFAERSTRPPRLLVYSALLALAVASILYWRVFPDCLVEGGRITLSKRAGLIVSSAAYLACVVLLIARRRELNARLFRLLVAAGTTLFVKDFTPAIAPDMTHGVRIVAHLSQVVALYFVYKAFIEVGLRRPYDLLFRHLKRSEESLVHRERELQEAARAAQLGKLGVDAGDRHARMVGDSVPHLRTRRDPSSARLRGARPDLYARELGGAESHVGGMPADRQPLPARPATGPPQRRSRVDQRPVGSPAGRRRPGRETPRYGRTSPSASERRRRLRLRRNPGIEQQNAERALPGR